MESALRQVPPPELKSVTWFITRAREMFSVDKVVTFYGKANLDPLHDRLLLILHIVIVLSFQERQTVHST